jgi:hypothetical protein
MTGRWCCHRFLHSPEFIMKPKAVPLSPSLPVPGDRLLRRSALAAFRSLRAAGTRALAVPDLFTLAVQDVRDAWRESARPNV